MASSSKGKVCYYELLNLDRKCEPDQIKKEYRKLALKMHPDKAHLTGLSIEEATQKFQVIQEAYSVLSDPQERAWYDSHREQILRGDDEPGEDPFKTKINLYRYFSASCFRGYGDAAGGFFAVYADLFRSIDKEEEEWEDADEDHVWKPAFGESTGEWADVNAFYKSWNDFFSRKAFGHADKWNLRDAPNRQTRRAMEQENKKARQVAKKEFNAEVRQVVQFAYKRDPRVIARQKHQKKESADKIQREASEKEGKKAADAKEKEERKEASRLEEEARYKEVQDNKARRKDRGEDVSDSEEEEQETQGWFCEPCHKTFKSEKAFKNHTMSKKHKELVAKFIAEQSSEEEEEEEEESSDESSSDEEPAPKAGGKASSGAPAKKGGSSDSEEGSSDDATSSEEDFVARFAAKKKQPQPAFSPPSREEPKAKEAAKAAAKQRWLESEAAKAAKGSSESESDLDAEMLAATKLEVSSKKAQKKEKQKAALLEKKAEKESVQELVKNVKKAQQAEKNGEEVPEDAAAAAPAAAPALKPAPKPAAQTKGKKQNYEPDPDGHVCGVCGEDFPSKSKLFQHVRDKGHAVFKEGPPEPEAVGKKGKKKR